VVKLYNCIESYMRSCINMQRKEIGNFGCFRKYRKFMGCAQNSMHRLATLESPLGANTVNSTLCGYEMRRELGNSVVIF